MHAWGVTRRQRQTQSVQQGQQGGMDYRDPGGGAVEVYFFFHGACAKAVPHIGDGKKTGGRVSMIVGTSGRQRPRAAYLNPW